MSHSPNQPAKKKKVSWRDEPFPELEVLPLALAGNWIAWSGDGLKIVAYAKTLVEAEQLARAAGEPEPIMERHPGVGRL